MIMRPGSDSMFCALWKVTDLFPMESQIHHPEPPALGGTDTPSCLCKKCLGLVDASKMKAVMHYGNKARVYKN